MPIISSSNYRKKLVLISGGAFHIFHDGIADGLAVLLPFWHITFGLSLTQVGFLASCYYGVTGIFQIPAGFLSERFGERVLLVWGTLITAIAFMCLGVAAGIFSLVLFLLIGGVGASVQHPLASSMISKAYDGNGRRMALGTYNFSGDIGKFLFPIMAALTLPTIGWRSVCTGFGFFGCILAVTLYFILRNMDLGGSIVFKKNKTTSFNKTDWGIVNKGAFSTLSVIGFIDTAARTALVTFGPFLFIQKGIQVESVGFALSLLFIGGAVGKFICGVLAERIGIITTVVITESITGGGIILLSILPLSYLYFFLPLLGAALNGTSSVLYGTVADFVDPSRIGRTFGLFYTFVEVAGAVTPPIMGVVSDMLGVEDSIRLLGLIALITVPMAVFLSKQMTRLNRE